MIKIYIQIFSIYQLNECCQNIQDIILQLPQRVSTYQYHANRPRYSGYISLSFFYPKKTYKYTELHAIYQRIRVVDTTIKIKCNYIKIKGIGQYKNSLNNNSFQI